MIDSYDIAMKQYQMVLKKLKEIDTVSIKELEKELEKIEATYTPGRLPK